MTNKESMSNGDYMNHGRIGAKDKYKVGTTTRVRDKSGYTQYVKQEKVTRV